MAMNRPWYVYAQTLHVGAVIGGRIFAYLALGMFTFVGLASAGGIDGGVNALAKANNIFAKLLLAIVAPIHILGMSFIQPPFGDMEGIHGPGIDFSLDYQKHPFVKYNPLAWIAFGIGFVVQWLRMPLQALLGVVLIGYDFNRLANMDAIAFFHAAMIGIGMRIGGLVAAVTGIILTPFLLPFVGEKYTKFKAHYDAQKLVLVHYEQLEKPNQSTFETFLNDMSWYRSEGYTTADCMHDFTLNPLPKGNELTFWEIPNPLLFNGTAKGSKGNKVSLDDNFENPLAVTAKSLYKPYNVY